MQNETVRILSFNVNGLKACLQRRYGKAMPIEKFLEDVGNDFDIVCLQETKLTKEELLASHELAEAKGWEGFFQLCSSGSSSSRRRAYSGTATFVRRGKCLPFDAELGFTQIRTSVVPHQAHKRLLESFTFEQLLELDSEGRVVVTHHGAFVLFNVYGPAITSEDPGRAQERMDFKMRFFEALEMRWQSLKDEGKRFIVVGDLNILPSPLDSSDENLDFYKENRPDRVWMQRMLQRPIEGSDRGLLVDCFREYYPSRRNAFTCWSQLTGARLNNYGSRIDLCLSSGMPFYHPSPDSTKQAPVPETFFIQSSDILPEVDGS